MVQARQWAAAADLADRLALLPSLIPAGHYLIGVVRWQQGNKVTAIQEFRWAEKLGLETPYLHKALALAYFEANQFLLFQDQMTKALRLDPADSEPHFHLGRYHESIRNDFEVALEHFNKAVALNPDDYKSYYFRGYCLEILQRKEGARASFLEAIRVMDGAAERFSLPFQGLARLSRDAEREQALEWAQWAVSTDPADASSHYVLAQIYERLGRPAEAAAALSTAVRLDPDDSAARFLLSTVYRQLGRKEESEAELARFKELIATYGDH